MPKRLCSRKHLCADPKKDIITSHLRVLKMEEKTLKTFAVLKEVNEILIIGLEGAIYCMENWEKLNPETRKSTINKIKALVVQSKKYYEARPTVH